MAHAVVTDGPYYSTGPISFSTLRTDWLGADSGTIKASQLFRNTNRNVTNPVVADSTENADIAPDTYPEPSYSFSGDGEDWKVSQMRGSIKSYTINQTNSGDYDKNVDGDNLAWNSNLNKNIPKYYNIQGNIHAVTDLDYSTTEQDNALKFVSNKITNLNIVVSGSVLGSGGKGASNAELPGENGGHAIKLDSNNGKNINVSVTNSGKIYGGGGGGGWGGKGSMGPDGVYYKPRDAAAGGAAGSSSSGLGEWYSFSNGGDCQCEWYIDCQDQNSDIWHWSVKETGFTIDDGGSGYKVGDIVKLDNPAGGVKALAKVTSVKNTIGVKFAANGDLLVSGYGSRKIVIRMGWDDNVSSNGAGLGQYKIPSLGVDFTQNILDFDRGNYDDESSSPWTYGAGQYVWWEKGFNYSRGYGTYWYSRPMLQVPAYSRQNYKDGNGNPNETAPWTQIVTVTGNPDGSQKRYPCQIVRPQNLPQIPNDQWDKIYRYSDNNLPMPGFRANDNKRLCFTDPHSPPSASTVVWIDELKDVDSNGNPKNIGKSSKWWKCNPGTRAADYDSALPSVGESYVTGIKMMTGGTKYSKSYDGTVVTTSNATGSAWMGGQRGNGSGLKIKIKTDKGWLRDPSNNTKFETQSGYDGTVLKLGSGTYASNTAGGGCNCFIWCRRTCIRRAYCIVEDPAIGIGANGGAGGAGGQGRGSNGAGNALMPRTDGVDGTPGDKKNRPTTTTDGGNGGDGGDGGDWAVAGGDGQNGRCNGDIDPVKDPSRCVDQEFGTAGGAAGRAIFGKNYTVNDGNFNSTRVKGAYQPS